MSNTIFVKQGSKLKISDANLCVEVDSEYNLIPFNEIEIIIIENLRCSITASVIVECSMKGIPIIYCNNKHTPVATTDSLYSYHRQTKKIQEQMLWTTIRKERLFVKIVERKIKNQCNLLKYIYDDIDEKYFEEKIRSLNKENVLSVEAQVAKKYFNNLYGSEFKRHEKDYPNFLLNYGYAIIRSKIRQVIVSKGLHPSLGIMHNNQFNNYNLSDDIIEVYRPLIDYYVHVILKSSFEESQAKNILQGLLFQRVMYDGVETGVRLSIELFVDGIIKYMNKSNKEIVMPILEVDMYELQI